MPSPGPTLRRSLALAACTGNLLGLTFCPASSVEDDSLFFTSVTNGQAVMLNGKALLVLNDGIHGAELWFSDGTDAGTALLRDIRPGPAPGDVRALTAAGKVAYFSANNGVNGAELWRTDGTTAGTAMVHDLVPGSGSSSPGGFAAADATVYFTANHPSSGTELWKTNGTVAGTVLVADINAGTASSFPSGLLAIGSTVYFSAEAAVVTLSGGRKGRASLISTIGRELWKSNGTAAGTVLVKDIYAGFNGSHPHHFIEHNGVLLFGATTVDTGSELWRSDGTAAGTFLLRDISRGMIGSFVRNLTSFNGLIYFNAGGQLWRTDGTTSGTQSAGNLAPFGSHSIGPKVGPRLSLVVDDANGTELWTTDGTPAGSQFLRRLAVNDPTFVEVGLGFRPNIIGAGDLLFFNAHTPELGVELYATNGTAAATGLVRDFTPFPSDLFFIPRLILGESGRVFLAVDSGVSGDELWVSDGTDAGTHLVKDILAD